MRLSDLDKSPAQALRLAGERCFGATCCFLATCEIAGLQREKSNLSATAWTHLVTDIHATDFQIVLAVTGGGSKAISQLLEVAGASRTVIEATVPYSLPALANYLGGSPDQACAEPTARAMAMTAWKRASDQMPDTDPYQLLGVGATASLATDRDKRGAHRVHVAIQSATRTSSYYLPLTKGRRDRKKEQWLAAKLILLAVGDGCEVESSTARQALLEQLHDDEPIGHQHQDAEPYWTDLLLSQRHVVAFDANQGADHVDATEYPIIFPGAFHPPHAGHLQMANLAASRLGQPLAFELSIFNVDKPPLDFLEIAIRAKNLLEAAPVFPVLLTDAPTFRKKSELFPGCTFVVGADTIARIADPRYTTGGPTGWEAAVREIADHGCRFLVFGRQIDGSFRTLSDLEVPDALRALCDEVPADEFREDVSSTELREEN